MSVRCDICAAEESQAPTVEADHMCDLLYLLGESMVEAAVRMSLCAECLALARRAAEFVRRCRAAHARLNVYAHEVKAEVALEWPDGEDCIQHSSDEEKPLHLLKTERDTQESSVGGDRETDAQHLPVRKKKKKKQKRDRQDPDMMDLPVKSERSVDVSIKKEGRRVVETEEYVVIRLTKEQILAEMSRDAESERYRSAQYRCDDCVKCFNYEDVLRQHREKHSSENGPYQCELCRQYCPSAVSLRGHMKSHSTRYECKACGAVRRSRQHLLEHHALTHAGAVRRYTCAQCGLTCTKRTMFQKHARTHANVAPLACDQCGKLFKTIETLRAHVIRHGDARRHACALCPRRYAHAAQLRQHARAHSARDHYCVECDVRFRTRSTLNAHLRRSRAHAPQHRCVGCDKSFATTAALAAHAAWAHEGRREHACRACGRAYATRDGLRAHARRAHEDKRDERLHECTFCPKTFRARGVLVKHVRVHTGERPYECAECGLKFAQSSTRTTHVRLVHRKVSRRAPKQRMADDSEDKVVWVQVKGKDGKLYRMQVHANSIQAVKKEKPTIVKTEIEIEEPSVCCPRCSKEFYNQVALSNHLKLQHGIELAELPPSKRATTAAAEPADPAAYTRECNIKIGGRKTGNVVQLDKNQLVSLASEDVDYIIVKSEDVPNKAKKPKIEGKGRRPGRPPAVPVTAPHSVQMMGPFECLQSYADGPDAVCHQVFFNCCEYSMHYRREHTRHRKPGARCQVCEKNLDAQLAGLSAEDAEVQCMQCKIKFDDAESLKEHMRIAHVKPRPFRCNVCDKGFTQQGGLMQHMRMHNGERPFTCSYCNKTFTQKSGLEQHIRIHTKDKPFRCVVCNKSFCQSIHMKQHMRTHTNIHPYQCSVCRRSFKQGSQLYQHMRSHKNYKKRAEAAVMVEENREDVYILDTVEPVESGGQIDTGDGVDTGDQEDAVVQVYLQHEDSGVQVETCDEYYTVEAVEGNEVQQNESEQVYITDHIYASDQVDITDHVETILG